MDNTSIPAWLDRFEGIKQTGRGWQVRCPAHDDRQASLSVDPGGSGWLLYCHRGCDTHDVMAAIGLRMTDLYYDAKKQGEGRNPTHLAAGREAQIFFKKARAYRPCRKLHTMKEVAWAAFPHDEEAFVRAYVDNEELFLPFEEGMRYWIVLSDAWGWAWLGESWKAGSKRLDWTQTKQWLRTRMWQTWIKEGCNGTHT